MNKIVYLDTHIVLWLYAGQIDLISESCQKELENNALYVSPIILLELQYLFEMKKINKAGKDIIDTLTKELSLRICQKDFLHVILTASEVHWTRDPFDRILTAQAMVNQNKLLTKDRTILKHYKNAIW